MFVVSTYAQIGSVSIELSPPNLLITGSSVLITWRVEQPSDPQNFDLTFVSTCPTRPVPLQSVQPNNPPASATGASVTSGSFLVGLCDGDRIENTINVVAREVTSPGLNFSNPVTVLSDTIPPDPPNINPESDNFPKTVFTQTFQIFGNVDNSIPAGNATDKAETAGSVTVFFVDGTDPATGLDRRVILGGGLIQPNANFVATVDLSTLTFGQQVNLFIVATDPLGQESRPPKSLGLVTRGNGDNVALDNLRMTPPSGTITRHTGVLVEGTVSGSVAPFAVKFYVNGFLNSEIGGLISGQGFAHTLNLTQEGNNCIAAEVENGNTPIFKGARQEIGCIELDRVAPAAPNIVSPNPNITLVTRGPNFDLRVFTEGDKNLTNTLLPKLYVTGPNGISFSPISPISIQQGGSEQNITVSISNLPDGQHTIELQAEDEVGNTDPGSIARFSFIKDTQSPIVEEVRVNNVIAPQDNPPLFTRSDSIRVTIRLNEASTTPPHLQITPFNGTTFSAGFAEGGGTVFTYSFGVTQGQDGPVRINVSGGGDQAGNTISFTQNNLFFVDTRAPVVRDMIPAQFSVLSQSPERIRVIFEDPLYEPNGKVSGVDPSSATTQNITLLGPANNNVPIDIIEFDPVTIDIIPKTPVTLEGNYQLGIRVSDKAGNFSAKDTRLLFVDFTRIPEDDIKCFPENEGFSRFGVPPFPNGSPHFVEVKVNNSEFDVQKSSLLLKNIREIPQILPGVKSFSTTDTMRYTLNTPLPSGTEKDGRYLIESIVFDRAGNRTDSACTFIYDNCAPSVMSIFPENLSFTARNLRSVSAVLKDCQPRFDVEFSDIDLQKSTIKLFQVSGVGGVETEILSRLRFETLPDQKAQKLLLEIVTTDGVTTSLPNDGSADGLYRIEVMPMDKSGNQGAIATSTFTLDTQSPILEIEGLMDNQSILANNILLKGRVRDNPNGSGMQKIEVKVESVVGSTPATVLMDFSPVFLAGPGLPPFSPNPPFQNFLQEIQLTLNQDVDARITLRAYDKAGNYNDFSWKVKLLASDLKPPVKSQPLSNFSTNLYFVHFAWEKVPEATSYEIELITPNINSKTYHTQNTYETINVAALAEGEGAYQWTIRGIDALGIKGQKSTSTRFFIDQTKPKINSIQIQDPSPESKGAITAGITRFLITFSEPVNINNEPKVFLQPVDIGQFTEQKLEILSFQETTLLARIKIDPPTANKPGLHGLGRLVVQNISDLATNPMEAQDGGINVFEIHSGPYFDFKFFTNPVDRDALTIAVKGLDRKGGLSVDVPTEPSVIAISTDNQEIALPVLRLTQSAFS
ncbi:MAG: Ig-like domain repeat protein, partial [Candidatus Cloacimonetes bacterium]|nr:Ig-like domain repeat protein [Candidatus Cloacimonadota bacterium]